MTPQDPFNCADVRALVVGWGSIGQRHARLLAQAGARVTVVSRRNGAINVPNCTVVSSLSDTALHDINYLILARETAAHFEDLVALSKMEWAQDIPILVEKPLVGTARDATSLKSLSNEMKNRIHVGFNLRFLPVVMAARRAIEPSTPLIRAAFESHSFLPSWRPGQDYRKTSSAQKRLGGGVLRDLSHELDLAQWFCGSPQDLETFGGKLSNLEIDVEDNVQIVGKTSTCRLLSVSLSYSQHFETRKLSLQSDAQTVIADLMSGELRVADEDGVQTSQHPCSDFDNTYRAMHQAILHPADISVASFQDGTENTLLIDRLTTQLEARSDA